MKGLKDCRVYLKKFMYDRIKKVFKYKYLNDAENSIELKIELRFQIKLIEISLEHNYCNYSNCFEIPVVGGILLCPCGKQLHRLLVTFSSDP